MTRRAVQRWRQAMRQPASATQAAVEIRCLDMGANITGDMARNWFSGFRTPGIIAALDA